MTLHVSTRHAVLLTSVSLALAASLSACGSNNSDSSGSSSSSPSDSSASATISKDDFVTQGNAICKKGNDEIAAIGTSIDTTDQQAITDALTKQVLPNISGQIDQLKALGYPEGDQATLDKIYSEASGVIDQAEQDPTSMVSGDPFADINTQLNDYGLTECGSDS